MEHLTQNVGVLEDGLHSGARIHPPADHADTDCSESGQSSGARINVYEGYCLFGYGAVQSGIILPHRSAIFRGVCTVAKSDLASSYLAVRPSVRPHGTTPLPLEGFS